MAEDKQLIPFDEAIKLLSNEDNIHTFRQVGPILIGADWERNDLLEAMKKAPEIEITGPQAQAIHHGLAICDKRGWLFIETVKESA